MYLRYFIPASNESSAVLTRTFDLFYHSLFISAELFHKIPYKLRMMLSRPVDSVFLRYQPHPMPTISI